MQTPASPKPLQEPKDQTLQTLTSGQESSNRRAENEIWSPFGGVSRLPFTANQDELESLIGQQSSLCWLGSTIDLQLWSTPYMWGTKGPIRSIGYVLKTNGA